MRTKCARVVDDMTTEVDWAQILKLYEAGTMGARELARMFQVPESTVRKRAKAAGIAPAQRGVRVSERVQQALDKHAAGAAITPEAVENALVEVGADIVKRHRGLIERGVVGVEQLLTELATVSQQRDAVINAVETLVGMAGPDAKEHADVLIESMVGAVDLGPRAKAAQALSAALKNLIGLQRQAFNLPANVTAEGTPSADSTLRNLLDEIDGADTGLG